MKTYRFVTKTHQDVPAETLDEAIEAFNGLKRGGISTQFDSVIRIEVEDDKGECIPADRPLRAGDLDARKGARIHRPA